MQRFFESDLADFLIEHENEWWTPYEVAQESKVDIRTIKNGVKTLSLSLSGGFEDWRYEYSLEDTAHRGFRIEVVQRRRIYAARMVKDLKWSIAKLDEEIGEVRRQLSVVQRIRADCLEEIVSEKELFMESASHLSPSDRDEFSKFLSRAVNDGDPEAFRKLKGEAEYIKERRIEWLNEKLDKLSKIKGKLRHTST
jgi:predicted transcriptional regulator